MPLSEVMDVRRGLRVGRRGQLPSCSNRLPAPMPTWTARSSRRAILLAIGTLLALSTLAAAACASSPAASSSAESIRPAAVLAPLEAAVPDANVGPDAARRWVDRARRDSRAAIPGDHVLVPLFVHAEPGHSIVILGDDSSGVQILARYDGDDPTRARLIEVEHPASKTTGLSAWEVARVRAVLAGAPAVGSLAPARMTILSMGWDRCPGGTGACAIVRLDDPDHPTPPDAPALAPQIAVRLSDGMVLPVPSPASGG